MSCNAAYSRAIYHCALRCVGEIKALPVKPVYSTINNAGGNGIINREYSVGFRSNIGLHRIGFTTFDP
jgi:hypothetical protein